jgi:hypothetical protein
LQRIYDKSQISRELARCLKHYLQPDYENIEYELSNNGCGNLLADIAKELKKYGEHYSLEKLAERIGEGYYGE